MNEILATYQILSKSAHGFRPCGTLQTPDRHHACNNFLVAGDVKTSIVICLNNKYYLFDSLKFVLEQNLIR